MKQHSGPRQNLSSYFSNNDHQVEQQLFGEEDEGLNSHYDSNEKLVSTHSKSQNRQVDRNTNILQHFYNQEESDGEEQLPPPKPNRNIIKPPQLAYNTKSGQPSTRQKKPGQIRQIDQQFPVYPNYPYQFFPFYPPFYSPYSAGMPEETIKEQQFKSNSNDTFMTDKSVESSIFFEKDKNIEMLLAESREMKQIIQHQSETIELILKKLEDVCVKFESFSKRDHIFNGFTEKIVQNIDIEEPQPRQPPLNASNNFFNVQNSSSRNSTNTLYSNNSTVTQSKFPDSQFNESMTNNTSSLNPKVAQNSNTLERSVNKSDIQSNRYSVMISPTISNSPIRSSSSQSSRLNFSQSSKKSILQNTNHSTISTNSQKSLHLDEKNKSPLSSSKDFDSPTVRSTKSDKQKRTSDDSFLNASHMSESMDLLGDAHGDDSLVYNTSYMSSYSSSHLEPFSTEMQRYVKEKILVSDVAKKEDIAKDSENTFMTRSNKKKENNSLSYSSSNFPIKSFSKI